MPRVGNPNKKVTEKCLGCENYFYDYVTRKRKYCSNKCSARANQNLNNLDRKPWREANKCYVGKPTCNKKVIKCGKGKWICTNCDKLVLLS